MALRRPVRALNRLALPADCSGFGFALLLIGSRTGLNGVSGRAFLRQAVRCGGLASAGTMLG